MDKTKVVKTLSVFDTIELDYLKGIHPEFFIPGSDIVAPDRDIHGINNILSNNMRPLECNGEKYISFYHKGLEDVEKFFINKTFGGQSLTVEWELTHSDNPRRLFSLFELQEMDHFVVMQYKNGSIRIVPKIELYEGWMTFI